VQVSFLTFRELGDRLPQTAAKLSAGIDLAKGTGTNSTEGV